MPDPRDMTLASIGGGAAEELFAKALEQVVANIDDPNTDPEAKRAITVTVVFVPNEDRRTVKLMLGCNAKLATLRPLGSTAFVGRHEGRLVAREALPQEDMFTTPQGRPQPVAENQERSA